jgi:hypothetical protein
MDMSILFTFKFDYDFSEEGKSILIFSKFIYWHTDVSKIISLLDNSRFFLSINVYTYFYGPLKIL